MLRIISGNEKGRKLLSPIRSSRPLTDRIKTVIFDLIKDYIPKAEVLDIFAGSGSFGFESLSRGADSATFVDASSESITILHKNKKFFANYNVNIHRFLSELFLKKCPNKYDLIFLDPPFPMEQSEVLTNVNLTIRLLKEDGVIIIRLPVEKKLPQSLTLNSQNATKVYETILGKSRVCFFK